MWAFKAVASIEQQNGNWFALVTFDTDEGEKSEFLNFNKTEPTAEQVEAAAARHAKNINLSKAVPAPSTAILREEFFNRFTVAEVAAIYGAAAQNPLVMAYIKRMEMNPVVHNDNPDVAGGLQLLEQAGLLAAGRAAQIMEW